MKIAHYCVIDYQSRDANVRLASQAAELSGLESLLIHNRPGPVDPAFSSSVCLDSGPVAGLFTRPTTIRRALDEFGADVVHLHGGPLTPLMAAAPCWGGRRVVASVYDWPEAPSLSEFTWSGLKERRSSSQGIIRSSVSGLLGERAAALGARRCSALLSSQPQLADALRRRGVQVLDWTRMCEPAPVTASLSEAPVVVFAGKAERVRGAHLLVEAWPEILRRHPSARLRLALLQGPALEELAQACQGLEAVELTTTPVSLDQLWAHASVSVYPFAWSATLCPTMAPLEGMARGVPLVSTDVSCLKPLNEGPRGTSALVLPDRSPKAIAEAVSSVLSDPTTWTSLSEKAQLGASRWTGTHADRDTLLRAYTAGGPTRR